MKTYTIDLGDHRTPGAKVFTGRDRGIEVREASGIDQLEPDYDEILVKVPADIRSINPSFLEEFFYNVIPALGEEGFHRKFKFENALRYDITKDLEEAIERRLREENALVAY